MSETPSTTPSAAAAAPRYSVAVGDIQRDKAITMSVWREGGFVEQGAGDNGARFDWFYGAKPAGEGQLNLLMLNADQPIGSLGVCPRQMMVGAKAVLAGVLVDFVVHPAHRTALPALQLQRAGRARASESMDILYGLPDTKAIPIFKRLGHQVQFPLPSYTRVLRAQRFLARIMPTPLAAIAGAVVNVLDAALLRFRIWGQQLFNARNRGKRAAWSDTFEAGLDRLWERLPKDGLCIGIRDAAFLKWRFSQRPGHSHKVCVVSSPATGEVSAYFVCEVLKEGIAIKDCLCAGGTDEWVHALNLLCVEAKRLGADALFVHLAGPAYIDKALRSVGFRQRSARPFFASVKENTISNDVSWFITQADEDI